MRYAKLLPMIAVVLTAACMNDTSTGPDEASLNARITTTTECVREPGPDNTLESTSKNPAGKEPRGQQEPDETVTNGENNCQKSKN
jgi:hypothetical protein